MSVPASQLSSTENWAEQLGPSRPGGPCKRVDCRCMRSATGPIRLLVAQRQLRAAISNLRACCSRTSDRRGTAERPAGAPQGQVSRWGVLGCATFTARCTNGVQRRPRADGSVPCLELGLGLAALPGWGAERGGGIGHTTSKACIASRGEQGPRPPPPTTTTTCGGGLLAP